MFDKLDSVIMHYEEIEREQDDPRDYIEMIAKRRREREAREWEEADRDFAEREIEDDRSKNTYII